MSELVAVAPRTVSGTPGLGTVSIEQRGGAAVITVSGSIDAESASLMRDALVGAISCHERVVVDLSRAEYIDRTGLSMLIAAQDGAHNRAVQLCFTAPSPQLLSALCEIRAGEALATVDPAAFRPKSQPCEGAGFTLPRPPDRFPRAVGDPQRYTSSPWV